MYKKCVLRTHIIHHQITVWIFYLLLRHRPLHLTQGNIDVNLSIQLYILNIFLKKYERFQKFLCMNIQYQVVSNTGGIYLVAISL